MRFFKVVSSLRKQPLTVFDIPVIEGKEPFAISILDTDLQSYDHSMATSHTPETTRRVSQQRKQDPQREPRIKRPTLAEILADTAPAPWTLSAFTAYAAQNLCQENIDFTVDAKQYEKLWQEVLEQSPDSVESPDSVQKEKLKQAWKRIMRVYMTPNGPREINLPGDVRSALLSIPESSLPPSPVSLKLALKKIYDLMEESIFFPFLNDVQAGNPSPFSGEFAEKGSPSSRHSATTAPLRPSVSHGLSAVDSSSSRTRPTPHPHHSHPLPHLSRPSSHPAGSQSSKATQKPSGSGSISGSASGALSLSEEPGGSMASVMHETSPSSTTPPPSEAGGRKPRQRSPVENPWRKIGSRLGFRKRSGSGLKEQSERLGPHRGRSPGPVFEED